MRPQPIARFIPQLNEVKASRGREPSVAGAGDLRDVLFAKSSTKVLPKAEEAYARGYEAGRAAAYAEFQEQLKRQQEHNEQQMALERYGWVNREAETLAARIDDGLKEVEARIAATIARLLRPFLGEAARNQAVGELVAALEILLGTDDGVTLEISGPQDLLEMLRGKLASRNVAVLFAPDQGIDVRVSAGQTVLETNLRQWMQRVEERTA